MIVDHPCTTTVEPYDNSKLFILKATVDQSVEVMHRLQEWDLLIHTLVIERNSRAKLIMLMRINKKRPNPDMQLLEIPSHGRFLFGLILSLISDRLVKWLKKFFLKGFKVLFETGLLPIVFTSCCEG